MNNILRDKVIDLDDYEFSDPEHSYRDGCETIIPETHQLTLDLDSEESYERFKTVMLRLPRALEDGPYINMTTEVWASSSGLPNRHVLVSLTREGEPAPINPSMRIALQMALGSDPNREIITLLSFISFEEMDSCLHRPLDFEYLDAPDPACPKKLFFPPEDDPFSVESKDLVLQVDPKDTADLTSEGFIK